MDWTTFFRDNSQSFLPLGGVFLGSAITFLISYLNNRFEARERDKDRQEQRREAKIQSREKWIERDVLRMMDSVETLLKMHSEIPLMRKWLKSLPEQEDSGFVTEEESIAKLKLHYERVDKFQHEIYQTMDTMTSLAYSLKDEEIESKTNSLIEILTAYVDYLDRENDETLQETDSDIWITVKRRAGEFRKVLRDKIVEIRDSEP